jgi:hypothetical protein
MSRPIPNPVATVARNDIVHQCDESHVVKRHNFVVPSRRSRLTGRSASNLRRVLKTLDGLRNWWQPVLSPDRPNFKLRQCRWGLRLRYQGIFPQPHQTEKQPRTTIRTELSTLVGLHLANHLKFRSMPVCRCREGRPRQLPARRAVA